MKTLLIGAVLATFVIAAPAQAHKSRKGHGRHAQHGRHMAHRMGHNMGGTHPASVKIDGVDVPVCAAKGQDRCVNPREAGLNFGNRAKDTYRPH
jgi:hypothetical protein